MEKAYLGSCLCGEVTFEVDGEFDGFFLCHCSRCQKGSGSAHASNLFSKSAVLKWKSGDARIRSYNLAGTRHSKSFCETCGSPVPYHLQGGPLLVVPAGSLDSAVRIAPTAHIFCASKPGWAAGLDQIQRFDQFPQ